jgi:hypothetical protein
VVDVDDPRRVAVDELAAQDLHVARQHDGVVDVPSGASGILLLRSLGGDREELETMPKCSAIGQTRMIAHDQGDLAAELAGAVAEQEVVEAMVVARDEDRDPLDVLLVVELPAHLEAVGDLADRRLEREPVGVHLGAIERDPLEELAGDGIGVLIRVEDVRPVSVEELRQSRDEPRRSGPREERRGGGLVPSLEPRAT